MPFATPPPHAHLASLLRSLDFPAATTYLQTHPPLRQTALPNGHTPLQFASLIGATQVVTHLLSHSVPPDALSIECAARNNHPQILALLLQRCPATASHNFPCTCDTTIPGAPRAVYTAAWHAHPDCVNILLNALCETGRRAVWRYRACDGGSALHAAALGGDLRLVRLLLQAGADVHAVDALHRRPLDLARRFVVASGCGEDVVAALQNYVEHAEGWKKGKCDAEETDGSAVYCLVERVEGVRLREHKPCHPV